MPKNKDDRFVTLRRADLAGSKVEKSARIIEGFIVIEQGNLRDSRPWMVDQTTMEQLVNHGNVAEGGIKVRWTHPDFMSDHLGKYLGRAKNFRIDGTAVRADIHFAESAALSPVFDRDPVAYILALAEEDPQAFATSIYFERDFDAMEALADDMNDDRPVPIRVAEFIASDIVDDGAAAKSFFSKKKNCASQCGEGGTDSAEKEINMAEEAKKIEEAQALAREEAKKADAERLERLQAQFQDSDFVLAQFAKGHDVVEAKADWADVLEERLAKTEKEAEELKAKAAKETKEDDGEEPLESLGNGDSNETPREKFDRLVDDYVKSHPGSNRTQAMGVMAGKHVKLYRDAFNLHNIFQDQI